MRKRSLPLVREGDHHEIDRRKDSFSIKLREVTFSVSIPSVICDDSSPY